MRSRLDQTVTLQAIARVLTNNDIVIDQMMHNPIMFLEYVNPFSFDWQLASVIARVPKAKIY